MNGNRKSSILIGPPTGWAFIDFKELWQYSDLFYFLVWRNVKVLYAQTILGFSWAIIQPLIQVILFTIIFGEIAKIPSDGMPYVLFSGTAIIPWTYLSQTIPDSGNSLISEQHMLGKIYFPRIIYPLTPILAKLIDFVISIVILIPMLLYYGVKPSMNLIFFPLFIPYMMFVAAGIGIWLSAMVIRFRDVKHAINFMIRMLMYTAPVVYSASSIPKEFRILYSLNPVVGIVEGFRACLLGVQMPWLFIWPGSIVAVIIFVGGVLYFNRMERFFVDVI